MDIFMQTAIDEARQRLDEGGIPIDSVLVKGERLVVRSSNNRVQENELTMHAEISCLRQENRSRNCYHRTTLCSTLIPYYLCAGAVVRFGIKKVVVGEFQSYCSKEFLESHEIEIIDLDLDECKQLLGDFIQNNVKL